MEDDGIRVADCKGELLGVPDRCRVLQQTKPYGPDLRSFSTCIADDDLIFGDEEARAFLKPLAILNIEVLNRRLDILKVIWDAQSDLAGAAQQLIGGVNDDLECGKSIYLVRAARDLCCGS